MPDDFEVLITAQEAWPAFEHAVLNSKSEIIAGFRIFDLRTKLRSKEAQAIGQDWFDLIAHVAARGVSFDLTISDFDPVFGTELHEMTWTTMRQCHALKEVLGHHADKVQIRAHLHPATAGTVPWLAFLPSSLKRQNAALAELTPSRKARQAVQLKRNKLPRMHTVTHHQKLAVIDGEVLYIGGLDLNERRWDTPKHDLPASKTWSDVQVLMRGPEAQEARAHLKSFVAASEGKTPPSKARSIKRTLSMPRQVQFPFLSPRSALTEIEEAHLSAFKDARHLIHIETQFFRSSRIADALASAASKRPDLKLLLILPALPEALSIDDNDGLDTRYGMSLQKSALATIKDGFGERLILATPVRPMLANRETLQTLCGSPTIHVHNKALVVDDRYTMIGSANLNGRSLRWDTEVAVETNIPARVAHARKKLLQHWWFDPIPDAAYELETLHDWWQRSIRRNGVVRPENRTGFLVPHDPANRDDLAQPLPGVTEDIV